MEKIKKLLTEQFKNLAPAFGISLAMVLFATLATNLFYQPKKDIKRGFEIEISADGKPVVKKAEKIIDLASMMKTADASRGEKIFKKCASCHSAEKGAGNKVGPNLFGVIGRARASVSGFSYSEAIKAKGGAWDKDSINQFITKPKDYIAGTKMAFPGLKKPQDRADVILYLEKNK
jgi:cytochrome c